MDETSQNDFQDHKNPGRTRFFIIFGLIFLILAAILVFMLIQKPQTPNVQKITLTPTPLSDTNSPNNSKNVIPGQTKLENTAYAHLAHQIFPGPIAPQDASAVEGYNIKTVARPDGSTVLTATTAVPGYGPIEVPLKPGQKAYFVIETQVSELGQKDADLGDNFIVVIDKNGTIVQN